MLLLFTALAGSVALGFAVWRLILAPYLALRELRKQGIETMPFVPIIGNLLSLRALGEGPNVYHQAPKAYVFMYGPFLSVQTIDLDVIRDVCVAKQGSFVKDRMTRVFRHVLQGDGLLTLEGAAHAHERALLNPAFHHDALRQFVASMTRATRRHIEQLAAAARGQGWVEREAPALLSAVTLDIIGAAAMGTATVGDSERVYQTCARLTTMVVDDILAGKLLLPFGMTAPTPGNAARLRLNGAVRAALLRIIRQRRAVLRSRQEDGQSAVQDASWGSGEAPEGQLLDMLLVAYAAELDDAAADDRLYAHATTFLVAGHETTSTLLSWTLHCLSLHPEWADRVRHETSRVLPDDPDEWSYAHLAQLEVTTMVLHETLRMYPPAPTIGRTALTDMRVGPISVAAGTDISMNIYALHRDPDLWDEPEAFRPERFRNGVARASKRPGAFMPFAAGRRMCIGKHFALLEAKVVLAMVLQAFDVRPSPKYQHYIRMAGSLRPDKGLPLQFSLRRA